MPEHNVSLTFVVSLLGAFWVVIQILDRLGLRREDTKQSVQCGVQHGELQESLAALADAVRGLTSAVALEHELSKARHNELLRTLGQPGGQVRT